MTVAPDAQIDAQFSHSFAVLAYKESPHISACLASLQAQTVASQIYVTTSTPSEYLRRTCNQYGVPLIVNSERAGIASDWNFAVSRCSTPYITLAHQDDTYLPFYTESMARVALASADLLMAFADYGEMVDGTVRAFTLNLVVKRFLVALAFSGSTRIAPVWRKKALLAFGSPIPCPSVMLHLRRLGDFRFSREYAVDLDWDAWWRIAHLDGTIARVRRCAMLHRIHSDSETTAAIGDNRRYQEDLQMFRRIWPPLVAAVLTSAYKRAYKSNV